MTYFEFLMAIASVVIAIGLTEIFGGWGDLLRSRIAPQIDWLHLSWTVVVVMYAIQYWVGIWPYREVNFSYIYQVWFLIIPTLFIVLVAFAITPNVNPDEDLRVHEAVDALLTQLGMLLFHEQVERWNQTGLAWTTPEKITGAIRWYIHGQRVGSRPIFDGMCSYCGCFLHGNQHQHSTLSNKHTGPPVDREGNVLVGDDGKPATEAQPPRRHPWHAAKAQPLRLHPWHATGARPVRRHP